MPKSSLTTEYSRLIVFKTAKIGWAGFMQVDETLQRVRIGFPSERSIVAVFQEFDVDPRKPGRWEKDLANRICGLTDPKAKITTRRANVFSDIAVDETWMTAFQKKVVGACRKVKFGETKSYGELAEVVGHGGAARAVGSVMSGNRYPIIVPCHRVVSSAGLGGFSTPRGLDTKRELLGLEGHEAYAASLS